MNLLIFFVKISTNFRKKKGNNYSTTIFVIIYKWLKKNTILTDFSWSYENFWKGYFSIQVIEGFERLSAIEKIESKKQTKIKKNNYLKNTHTVIIKIEFKQFFFLSMKWLCLNDVIEITRRSGKTNKQFKEKKKTLLIWTKWRIRRKKFNLKKEKINDSVVKLLEFE